MPTFCPQVFCEIGRFSGPATASHAQDLLVRPQLCRCNSDSGFGKWESADDRPRDLVDLIHPVAGDEDVEDLCRSVRGSSVAGGQLAEGTESACGFTSTASAANSRALTSPVTCRDVGDPDVMQSYCDCRPYRASPQRRGSSRTSSLLSRVISISAWRVPVPPSTWATR